MAICLLGGGMTTRAKNITYWTTTALVAFFIGSGGGAQVAQYLSNPHGIVPVLGYPMYFFAILGLWKVLGAIAILVPRFPRLKEWAYAGIIFDLTGAAASCAAVGGYGVYAFHVLAPLFLAVLAVASWALRPESRVIGILIPASGTPGVNARAAKIA
jgi:DoxX-like family